MSATAKMPPVPAQQSEAADRLFQVGLGYMGSTALNVAVELEIADLLAAGPRPVTELAQERQVNEDALYRVLRLLVSVGVFAETAPRTFALNDAARALRKDAEGSVHDLMLWMTDPFHFRVYSGLLHSVQTGQPAVDHVYGHPIFEYLKQDQREREVFYRAMTVMSALAIPAVLEAYDFSGIRVLVDVGGGHGQVTAAILERYPAMRGVICDLEHVVEGARPHLQQRGLHDRCELSGVDFFQSVPAGGDAYILKHIIHDWDDERCVTILRNIHRALGTTKGKVILLEFVLPAGNEPHFGKFLDIEMLVMPGGRERTEAEFRSLFEQARLRLTRVVPTKGLLSVIEAVSV